MLIHNFSLNSFYFFIVHFHLPFAVLKPVFPIVFHLQVFDYVLFFSVKKLLSYCNFLYINCHFLLSFNSLWLWSNRFIGNNANFLFKMWIIDVPFKYFLLWNTLNNEVIIGRQFCCIMNPEYAVLVECWDQSFDSITHNQESHRIATRRLLKLNFLHPTPPSPVVFINLISNESVVVLGRD